MTVKEFCKEYNLTEDQFYGREMINRDLFLPFVEYLPEDFSPTVGGSLYLDSVKNLPKGFNPTVEGHLYLNALKELPKGFTPTVGGNLCLHSVKKLPEGFNPTVEGHLYLESVKELPKGFNPKIGGSLDLESVEELPEGFNPQVGGRLALSSLEELPEGFNPQVGGSLYLNSVKKLPEGFDPICIDVRLSKGWMNLGEKIRFINNFVVADGLVTKIVSNKGNIYKVKRVASEEIFYLLITEEGIASHGKTYKEAKDSLIYKLTDKDLSDYKDLALESEISHSEAIQLYRKVTGACEYGTRNFVESNPELIKESYKISDLINLTKGHYGNDQLVKFFRGEE